MLTEAVVVRRRRIGENRRSGYADIWKVDFSSSNVPMLGKAGIILSSADGLGARPLLTSLSQKNDGAHLQSAPFEFLIALLCSASLAEVIVPQPWHEQTSEFTYPGVDVEVEGQTR